MLLLKQCPKCGGALRSMDFDSGVECINCGLTKFTDKPITKSKKVRTVVKK